MVVTLPFKSHPQVYLCENNIYNSDNMTDVITHELIHAFDNCRAKVDFLNPRHLACTEVRTSVVRHWRSRQTRPSRV